MNSTNVIDNEIVIFVSRQVEDRLMIVAAVGVAEITGIVMGEETVLNSLTPVGKSQIGKVVSRPSKRSVAGVIDLTSVPLFIIALNHYY